jgi:gliding motility-associated-like protein
MKKQYALWLLFFTISSFLRAQVNLVPNPSFEVVDTCDGRFASDWFTPISTSPDYFSSCITLSKGKSVPLNNFGYQSARTGNAYSGIITTLTGEKDYREYISCKFNKPLTAHTIYNIDFYVSLAISRFNIASNSISRIGSLLSSTNVFYDTSIYPIRPTLETDSLHFFDDTLNWMKVSFYYEAKGGEQYLIIGNFNTDNQTPIKIIPPYRPNASYMRSYYYIDDVSVVEYPGPQYTLVDTTLCASDSISLSMRPDFDSCIWNDGSKLTTRIFKQPGKYWITSYYSNWLSYTDTLIIRPFDAQSAITSVSYCQHQSLTLQSKPATSYLWSNGDTTPTIRVSHTDVYWVNRNNGNCAITDSFYVTENPLPIITSLKDTTVCFDEVARILLDAGTFKSYLWKPTGETTQTIYSTTAQVYLLTVTDSSNCTTSKQVAVMETCPDFVYVPTAFSPNNDGLNDVFLPKTRAVENYELTILNRWGAIIFTTQNPQQGWDGKDAPADVYIAQVRYNTAGKPTTFIKQNITLLR